jgi:hypothetical protein
VPRPDYIARLHAAKYDLRYCSGGEKPEMLRLYQAALEEAVRLSGVSAQLLEAAVARDFGEWVKQERLPKPPKPS